MDQMVLATQKYLNKNYSGKSGYNTIAEDGITGWSTIYALTRALQIELGLSAPANNFGNASTNAFKQKYPNGIKEQESGAGVTSRVYAIIQGALWCKGYSTGANKITEHFYSGTGFAVKSLKQDAGFENPDSTVTLNVMKALLSMDQFRVIYSQGGTGTIQSIQQQLNRKYEDYIDIIPCDGLYSRNMNKALIKVLQVIEGLSADGVFGNQTKAKCPILPDTEGKLSADVVEAATYLVKYALHCNGYEADVTTPDWSTAVEAAIKDFQQDLQLQVTGTVNVDTWMSLLLSKGNPDRACTACDTRFEITSGRADELKQKGYSIVGRYLTGTEFKVLRDDEPQRILDKGLNFFPIFQESSTNIAYFTEDRGKADADKAVRAARKFRIPEGTVIYFAVDLDATDPQITKYILLYFEALSQNIDSAYKVGIYGTRNVCTQVCDAGYAVTCFVSDMSTAYSGNMGFKMPSQWNYDQFAEIDMGNGDWAIDKDAYSGKFKPVKKLDTYVYEQPPKPSTEGLPTITEVLPLIEELERVYVEWYTPLFEAAPGALMPLTPKSLATGITNFLRSRAYTELQWRIVLLSGIDEGFVNYVKENYSGLYASLEPYMVKEWDTTSTVEAQLISDEHGGIIDLKHLAATTEGYFGLTAPIPKSWFGWGADLATTVPEIESKIGAYDGDYQAAADCIVLGDSAYFPYEDFCADADAIKLSQIISESSSTTHSFSESLRDYVNNYTEKRCAFIVDELKCLPNLTAIKKEVENVTKNAILQVLKGDITATDAINACCNSFANYIYQGLK